MDLDMEGEEEVDHVGPLVLGQVGNHCQGRPGIANADLTKSHDTSQSSTGGLSISALCGRTSSMPGRKDGHSNAVELIRVRDTGTCEPLHLRETCIVACREDNQKLYHGSKRAEQDLQVGLRIGEQKPADEGQPHRGDVVVVG